MRRTASHLISSPNPAQLEMRILANHGADRRFAFLRGRWSRAWKLAKGRARLELIKEKERQEVKTKSALPLGGLAGYGDSDGGSDSDAEYDGHSSPVEQPKEKSAGLENKEKEENSYNGEIAAVDDEQVKEARRARAKEWAAQRRAQQAS